MLLHGDEELLIAFTTAMQPVVMRIGAGTVDALADETMHPSRKPTLRLPKRLLALRLSLGERPVFSRPLKAAAVIAVVCLGVIAASHLLGPLGASTVSLAQTLEAMRGMSWVHVVETSSAEPGVVRESWECFGSHIVARKGLGGQVEYVDYANNAAYRYNPNSRKIAISLTTDNYMPAGPQSPFEVLSQMIDSATDEGAHITRQPLGGNDQRRERIRIVFDNNPHCESMTLVRDTGRNVLLSMETVAIRGKERFVLTRTFDYPQPGPADMYALGVPRDAAIFDTRPEGPALALIDEVQSRFERGLPDHIAVILESWQRGDGTLDPREIAVLRQKGTLKRSDHYRAFNMTSTSSTRMVPYPRIQDAWPNLTIPQVLSLESDAACERQMLFDGRRTVRRFLTEGRFVTDEHPSDQFKITVAGLLTDSLTALLWPNLRLEMQSGSSHYRKDIRVLADDPNHPGLVGLQARGFAQTDEWWFDPDKDYMLVERTRQQATSMAGDIVVQYQRTPSGRWYPYVIRSQFTAGGSAGQPQTSRIERRILLDLNPVFGEGVFDAAGLDR